MVITGCAHPGIVKIAERARQILPDRDLHLLMGGFHLGSSSEHTLKSIIEQFRYFKVQKVAPSHCSGDRCRYLFKKEYKENYIESGAGRVIELPRTGQTDRHATGDDGDLEKGVAWPTPRFMDNGNGTITDNLTGLMW